MQFHIRFLQALGVLMLVGWLVLLALPARAQASAPLTFSPVADA